MRPFGEREGIDFDRVERDLIAPVLDSLGIAGRTTQEIARAGNIRTDMFERLVLADLVIADISIHNANVYYELGIRHALRDRTTILIRARADDVPFDLRTDQYLEYESQDPGASRAALTDAVRQSVAAERSDSPVFLLLPALEPPDPEQFRPVPPAFNEDVRTVHRRGDRPMLAVLGEEAAGFEWGLTGARLVGAAQFDLKAWADARATWEWIRGRRPDDPEANLALGTIFQRLDDPPASSAAVERVLARHTLTPKERAEASALIGSNAKTCWLADWRDAAADERPAAALRSAHLDDARVAYDEAFLADQNHWYSGINALALTTMTILLAQRLPEVWAERFGDDEEIARELGRLERERLTLAAAVRRSLEADEFRRRRSDSPRDVWLDLTWADYHLLTSDRPSIVARGYGRARARLADRQGPDGAPERFPAESAARQIRIFLKLGILADNARAALAALAAPEEEPLPSKAPQARVLVFSGHRIDAPGRATPRFPADREQDAVRLIEDAVAREQQLADGAPIEGIAGGASGGDMIFHEVCARLGIPTALMLAVPQDLFAARSVADAGPQWMERYRALCARLDVRVLAETDALPSWLATRDDYTIWQRNNRWILHSALSRADTDATLIVLWDGQGGDAPGGTQDMVSLAEGRGVRVVRLDATPLAVSGGS